MSDFLLESSLARSVVKSLGLPLPTPERLERASGPWEERPLDGVRVLLGSAPGGSLTSEVARIVTAAGATPFVASDVELARSIDAVGEAFGRSARDVAGLEDDPLRALVFDASGITDVDGLAALHRFGRAHVDRLGRSGRFVVVGRLPESAASAIEAAARRALEGFVRCVAKEIGRRGSTAQAILVEPGAEARLDGPLRWILSKRSAFVSAQVIRVTARAKAEGEPAWVAPLDGKIALVTGAARGIGEATATRLAEEGARVVCLDRPEDGEAAGALAARVGGSVILADVAAADAADRIAAALRERHGGVDVLVHNAGVTRDKTLARMDDALWDQALAINLGAPVRITSVLLAGGLLRDGGRIVCLSSIAGLAGNVGQANYAAAKAGLVGFVSRLAGELAERGITANAVAPGFIETRMTAAVPMMVREVGRRLSALGQGGLARDVAEAITFLATPASAGLTGSVLRVCGGAFLGA